MKKNGKKQQKQNPGNQKQKKQKNRELAVITYLFIGLFTLLIGYFIYFETVLSPDVINNPYNSRQDSFA